MVFSLILVLDKTFTHTFIKKSNALFISRESEEFF